ncbi:MAG: tRNA (adenosine(37)-N6)-threonylcarbamoyltransferase complex dimerization subunit type 1 TsaB [Desulfovibrio sp.]|jgi:tRNA threonylcarbamoyl adenosine modification protein YeaZ|nr:tRNA (adenosine(37)-N6)-threonylcarbamoyltransferase complex dimerization subunit type 1 TsaB [Desulfovibrio sp.]
MILLVLNAAEGFLHLLLARLRPLVPLCSQRWHLPSQGAELLVPALEQALSALGLSPKDLTRIACVRGPGNFTGLRLALVTASGLARSTPAVLAGLDYLPLLAAQAGELWTTLGETPPGAEEGEKDARPGRGEEAIWALTRARRGVVYLQGFSRTGLRPLTAVLAPPLEEAARIIARLHAALGGSALLLGSGLTDNRAAWERLRPLLPAGSVFLPPFLDAPGDGVLLRAATEAAYSREDIAPLYVRSSDAEENLESISAALGLDPAAARKRLEELTGGGSFLGQDL